MNFEMNANEPANISIISTYHGENTHELMIFTYLLLLFVCEFYAHYSGFVYYNKKKMCIGIEVNDSELCSQNENINISMFFASAYIGEHDIQSILTPLKPQFAS